MDNISFETLNKKLCENSEKTEAALKQYFDNKQLDADLSIIKKAQTYSLLGGGKRIRPFLTNEVCKMLGGSESASMPFAIAVEMIHTYSLIHDDLPCMDNDDYRRGKLTNHKTFGEGVAVLAGDALLTNAFSAVVQNKEVSSDTIACAVGLLAEASGDVGMIGGQIKDIEGEGKTLSFSELLSLHELKTGRMIRVSAALGALAAGYSTDSNEFRSVCLYADKIGLVFQAIDDLLDVISDEETMGKSLSDSDNNKTTFLSFFDVEGVKEYAKRETEKAVNEISAMEHSQTLIELAWMLLNRNK